MIKEINGKFEVLSHRTGRSFGIYDTMAEAKKRLAQIVYWKKKLKIKKRLQKS